MAVIPEILDQHAEEAAFLWLLRDAAATAPHYDARELSDLDERVEAHLDGLRIAGEAGWLRCAQELEREEPGEVFVASVLALESADEGRLEHVLRVAEKGRSLGRGLVSALGWVRLSIAQPAIVQLLRSESSERIRLGLRGAAAHRWDPGYEPTALSSDPTLHAAELRSWAELGRKDRLHHGLAALDAPDPELRFWAAWSCVLLGSLDGLDGLREASRSRAPYATRALETACRAMPRPDAWEWHAELSGREETQRSAIVVAGILGDADLVPWLVDRTMEPAYGRIAGEALTALLGWDLTERPLEGEAPADFSPPPSDDPEEEEVAVDPDEPLPWPNPDALRERWNDERAGLPPGTRWLRGNPYSESALRAQLQDGSQRQRASAALELALAFQAYPLVETRALARRPLTWHGDARRHGS